MIKADSKLLSDIFSVSIMMDLSYSLVGGPGWLTLSGTFPYNESYYRHISEYTITLRASDDELFVRRHYV
ncbi:hypothetical protein OK016_13010 [Vibrio chagasii]|nr:hypothetical protein [Vibrio chagasii]